MDQKLFEKLVEAVLINEPAKITGEVDDKGKMTVMLDGRGIDIIALALAICERVIEESHLQVNDYCEMLKEAVEPKKNKSKEQQDVEKVIINKMLRDIFK